MYLLGMFATCNVVRVSSPDRTLSKSRMKSTGLSDFSAGLLSSLAATCNRSVDDELRSICSFWGLMSLQGETQSADGMSVREGAGLATASLHSRFANRRVAPPRRVVQGPRVFRGEACTGRDALSLCCEALQRCWQMFALNGCGLADESRPLRLTAERVACPGAVCKR